jgi:hypothetical protein
MRTCANCGTPGDGRYCGNCGQRLDVDLHSLWHFTAEATEVLTHADSRVWLTLRPLFTRPGELTREFIAGRRVRYLQPFRLYLVASVAFFLVGSLGGAHKEQQAPVQVRAQLQQAAREAGKELGGKAATALDESADTAEGCHSGFLAPTNHQAPDYVKLRLAQICERVARDNGQALGREVSHNVGRAMFVFLPLLAGLMKLLYWRPPRYYLEHLLLLLHNHAFVFLAGAALELAVSWQRLEWLAGWLGMAFIAYVPWYLFRSMRVYYGQGRALTLLKFCVLSFAYAVCGTLMLLVTTVYSAATL